MRLCASLYMKRISNEDAKFNPPNAHIDKEDEWCGAATSAYSADY